MPDPGRTFQPKRPVSARIRIAAFSVSFAQSICVLDISKCYRRRMRRTLRILRIMLMAYVAYGIIYQFPC